MCQCPLGLIPHFYSDEIPVLDRMGYIVSMPSRAYTSFLPPEGAEKVKRIYMVSMPSRAYTSFLRLCMDTHIMFRILSVNALSGLYLISTRMALLQRRHMTVCVNALSGLYLISTLMKFLYLIVWDTSCQCPLGLIPHFYLQKVLKK